MTDPWFRSLESRRNHQGHPQGTELVCCADARIWREPANKALPDTARCGQRRLI